jgi:hypothetical protein
MQDNRLQCVQGDIRMKKTDEVKGKYSVAPRSIRLSVWLTAEDKARLEELRVDLSPYSPLSLGKALSVAIQMAWSEKKIHERAKAARS